LKRQTRHDPADDLVASAVQDEALRVLYQRPGFLIRRAHQITSSLFWEESKTLGITSTQCGALYVLNAFSQLDQISLAKLVGFDRSTTAMVLKKLEGDGLVMRRPDAHDRRRKMLEITPRGRAVLAEMGAPMQRAQARTLEIFTVDERETLLRLLGKLVRAFNENSRSPLLPAGTVRAPAQSDAKRRSGKLRYPRAISSKEL
jgi:DNA-binding MarR family transcriptional regulator